MPDGGADRIDSLDVLRGLAVMGIVLANLPAFGLPEAAYFVPLRGTPGTADIVAWFATYVLVEGKMRGLFSLLFGASALLVIERAEASGHNAAAVHYRRMAVLFGIGCIHLYGIWWGDILAHYALCGALLYPFARLRTRWLVATATLLIVWQAAQDVGLYAALRDAQAHGGALARELAASFGNPSPADVRAEIAAYHGGYLQMVAWRWNHETSPVALLPALAPETLSTMLLGMVGYRTGFLTGTWSHARYGRWAAVGLGLGLALYVAAAIRTLRSGFALEDLVLGAWTLPSFIRLLPIAGYAAVFILLMRPGGRLTARIAAMGRCAFSNYLGTSLVLTLLFYGGGLFGQVSRAGLYLFAPPVWSAMLAWSLPWLRRYRYGPAEWAWRSLSRGRLQPMRLGTER